MADVPLMENPMTTAGDSIYGGASGAPTRLAIGTAGQVWTVNAGATAPEWADATGSGVDAGTSFPVSPTSGDLFWRTDRSLFYFYDGTRWLTVNEYTAPITARALNGGVSATSTMGNMPVRQDYDMYITRFESPMFVSGGTALSASHKWVITVNKIDASNTKTTISTITLDSGTLSTHIPKSDTPNVVVAHATYFQFEIVATKTGTPGSLFASWEMAYRLVG